MKHSYYFFLQYLIEFTIKVIWIQSYLLGEVFINKFSLLINIGCAIFKKCFLPSFPFFFFKGISLFHLGCQIYGHKAVHNIPLIILQFPYYLFNIVESVVRSSLSSLILVTFHLSSLHPSLFLSPFLFLHLSLSQDLKYAHGLISSCPFSLVNLTAQ